MKYLISDFKIPLKKWIGSLSDYLGNISYIADELLRTLQIIKKSYDARNKNDIKIIFSFVLDLTEKEYSLLKNKLNIQKYNPPEVLKPLKNIKQKIRPVIIGFGPAGFFSALYFVKNGIKPVIFEKGDKIETRIKKVNDFWSSGILDENSNVQFGEGGAGTFSDGKLNTQKNNSYTNYIKQILVEFGAPNEILYLAKPHLGTDNLKKIIINIRKFLLKNGVEIKYNEELTGFTFKNNILNSIIINNKKEIPSNLLILALGHSSRNTYKLLYKNNIKLSFKPFALGIRIEHPQDLINLSQYGIQKDNKFLPPADYKLTYKSSFGNGVYSFCMCPGGRIICASSENNQIVTNGMSNFDRNEYFGNSAIVVSITERDVESTDAPSELKGIQFQKSIEEKAFKMGGGKFFAPVQTTASFLLNKIDSTTPKTSYKPGVTPCNIHELFPDIIRKSLREGLIYFDKKIKGFTGKDAVIIAPETRTSSAVRILRNDTHESISHKGIFPCGEGSGYSGGIISSALDGLITAKKVIESYDLNSNL